MVSSIKSEDLRKFEEKYKEKIKKEFEDFKNSENIQTESRQYQEFKKQWMPRHYTIYEHLCAFSEKVFTLQPDKQEALELQESINVCHLNVTPAGVKSFSFVAPIIMVMVVALFSFIIPFIATNGASGGETFFIVYALILGLIMIIPLGKLPHFFANSWRMKASNQMVLCAFYLVTYMRHTSNLENAIDFAAEHLPAPLSLDLKKILWDVETQRYSSVKESLDAYLETWKKWNMEFIESVHLIESSLYETSESRRLDSLDKALNVILDETYEKMLHYAHSLQSPLTMLNMLGIVLPILGLVILPLVVSFIEEIKWYHLLALYNLTLPIGVYYFEKMILSTRPTGYGEGDISEDNPELKKYRFVLFNLGGHEIKLHPFFIAFSAFFILFLIGISPILIHAAAPGFDVILQAPEYQVHVIKAVTNCATTQKTDTSSAFALIGYKCNKAGQLVGPFGLGAAILSLAIPLSFGVGFGLYYRLRSHNVMKIREETKKVEQEFASALFQLGNRLGDGLPLEIAFSKVAESMEGTVSGKFFALVSINITKLGMSVEAAIFDRHKGALVYYPSPMIESSMKVLVESSRKGPLVASQAVINVSEYIKQIHRVDERLKDLMADTISSLQSQIAFLTPAIAGIVIGITSMITTILGSLTEKLTSLSQGVDAGSAAGGAGIGASLGSLDMFGLGIPAFYFQIIVGIYVVQIIYIMTVLVNGVRNGEDPLNERYLLGNNLISSTVLYVVIALIVMIIFNIVAGMVLGGTAGLTA